MTSEPTIRAAPPIAGTEGAVPGATSVLGRYRLCQRLGAGGFGVVWLAYDEKLEREVAIKAMPRDIEGDLRGGGVREARIAARLNHPGIVALYELAADETSVYLVSELVRGRTLADLAAAGAVADRDVARVGIALCDALAHAHDRGVIHRDVKPQNVMVVAEPAAGAGFAKLADFGVAHLATGDPLTRTGDVVGTLAYMAPEQADGQPAFEASDVYSLALTLYEALSGQNPVRAGGPAATARRLGRHQPPLARMRPELPARLCDALDAALEPLPGDRPPLDELRDELEGAEAQLSSEGGLVEAATQQRFGITAARRRPFWRGRWARRGQLPVERASVASPWALRLARRLGAGAGAGALVIVALERLGPPPPVSSLAAGAVAALLVALLPRTGWLLSMLAVCGWLVSPEGDRAGTALLLAALLAPVPALLPRAGVWWSVPALAPLCGLLAIAPLFVGVAALAARAWRRACVAAAGLVWLAGAEVISGKSLLFGVPDGTQPRGQWEGSISGAVADALLPLLDTPALAPAVVWGLFATVLPLVVRGRFLVVDALAGLVWAAGLAVAHGALGDLLAASVELETARGAVAGATLAALVAVAARTVAPSPPRAPAEAAGAAT